MSNIVKVLELSWGGFLNIRREINRKSYGNTSCSVVTPNVTHQVTWSVHFKYKLRVMIGHPPKTGLKSVTNQWRQSNASQVVAIQQKKEEQPRVQHSEDLDDGPPHFLKRRPPRPSLLRIRPHRGNEWRLRRRPRFESPSLLALNQMDMKPKRFRRIFHLQPGCWTILKPSIQS